MLKLRCTVLVLSSQGKQLVEPSEYCTAWFVKLYLDSVSERETVSAIMYTCICTYNVL